MGAPLQAPEGIIASGRSQFSGTLTLPSSCVGETQIGSNVIGAEYLEHRADVTYIFDGTVTTGDTEQLKVCHSAGYIKAVYVSMGSKPTSSDTVTVDVQLYTASWATVLTGVVSFSNSDTNEQVKTGTLTTAAGVSYAAQNKIRVVTAGTNTTGADLVVQIVCWENGS